MNLQNGGKTQKVEKMNKIELLNYWLNLTKFDENQTSFKIFSKDWKFNENNKKMIKFFNEWDDSGTTSLL